EGGGTVLLEEEVAGPGEGVAGDHAAEQPPEVERRKRVQQRRQAEAGADEVQPAVGPVRVLGQVERVEVGEPRERRDHNLLVAVRHGCILVRCSRITTKVSGFSLRKSAHCAAPRRTRAGEDCPSTMATILVADDNRANREALAALLETAGYR